MTKLQITNCHIHTFTNDHVPFWYPGIGAVPFRHIPGLARLTGKAARLFGQERFSDWVLRMDRFREIGGKRGQAAVFDQIRRYYPDDTRFVVLPMDLAHIGFGTPAKDLRAQLDELAALAEVQKGRVIPFATVYPDAEDALSNVRYAIETLGFKGLKLYPKLGFAPDHPLLLEQIYPMLLERNLPVMTHCSRGGVKGQQVSKLQSEKWTDPAAFRPVLDRYPELRVCLAHFGGQYDWQDYVRAGLDPDDPEARKKNWLTAILDLIKGGDYPGLWTDVSYTLFHFDDHMPFLKVFLGDETLRRRVLFGSDFYMTEQENMPERLVSVRMRDALGEARYGQIADTNPRVWLGEIPEPAPEVLNPA